jgi:hypothetical protein
MPDLPFLKDTVWGRSDNLENAAFKVTENSFFIVDKMSKANSFLSIETNYSYDLELCSKDSNIEIFYIDEKSLICITDMHISKVKLVLEESSVNLLLLNPLVLPELIHCADIKINEYEIKSGYHKIVNFEEITDKMASDHLIVYFYDIDYS